jgi:hypothetical protein
MEINDLEKVCRNSTEFVKILNCKITDSDQKTMAYYVHPRSAFLMNRLPVLTADGIEFNHAFSRRVTLGHSIAHY